MCRIPPRNKIPTSSPHDRGLTNWRTTGSRISVHRDHRYAPRQLPEGYQTLSIAGAVIDLVRPLKVAVNSISIVAVLLWIVAVLIVGSVVYLRLLSGVTRGVQGDWHANALDYGRARIIAAPSLRCLRRWCANLAQVLAPLFPMIVAVPVGVLPGATGGRDRHRSVR